MCIIWLLQFVQCKLQQLVSLKPKYNCSDVFVCAFRLACACVDLCACMCMFRKQNWNPCWESERYLPHYNHAYLRLHSTFTCCLAQNNEIIHLLNTNETGFISHIERYRIETKLPTATTLLQKTPKQRQSDGSCDVLIELWIKIKSTNP